MNFALKIGVGILVFGGLLPLAAVERPFKEVKVREIELFRGAYSLTSGMDFDSGVGDLTLERYSLQGFVGKPMTLFRDVSLIPFAGYELTRFDLSGAAIGVQDEDLHSISAGMVIMKELAGTPWTFFGFGRAELASDFEHITNDALTYDVGFIFSYRFSDTLSAGLGAVAINLNGEEEFYPGVSLAWYPNDCFQATIAGVVAEAAYLPSEDWRVALRAQPAGGDWNIENENGESMDIDLSSFRAGLFVSRRVYKGLWVEVGGGLTFGNELKLRNAADETVFSDDLDEGIFGQVAFSLRNW